MPGIRSTSRRAGRAACRFRGPLAVTQNEPIRYSRVAARKVNTSCLPPALTPTVLVFVTNSCARTDLAAVECGFTISAPQSENLIKEANNDAGLAAQTRSSQLAL